MDKFVVYIRVSTKKQGATGLGLDAQRKMCMDFISGLGGEFVSEFQDVESGTHRDRPGLWSAIEYCRAHDYTLVIAKLDRLARDVEFTFKVLNSGIQIRFCDMPIMNTMILGVFASVAQYERELCSSRTRAALSEIKENIEENGGHMSKANRWIKHLGREKGCDTSPASSVSARNSQRRANDWRQTSALYMWVENQILRRRPRKEILADAKALFEKNPSVYGTRSGKPLSKAILSLWAKEIQCGI